LVGDPFAEGSRRLSLTRLQTGMSRLYVLIQ
jgi:hypothetical protein